MACGYGHSPEWALNVINREHVMANVMTPSYEQSLLANKLKTNRKPMSIRQLLFKWF